MKKYLLVAIALLACLFSITNASAQTRIKIKEGLYLVSYGSSSVIEDDVNQRSISIQITQEISDKKTNQKVYSVVCGKWTKRVVKDGLKAAIAAGIAASGTSGGTSLIISAAATLANYIYDDVCDYYK